MAHFSKLVLGIRHVSKSASSHIEAQLKQATGCESLYLDGLAEAVTEDVCVGWTGFELAAVDPRVAVWVETDAGSSTSVEGKEYPQYQVPQCRPSPHGALKATGLVDLSQYGSKEA